MEELRILLVDGDEDSRITLEMLLGANEYEVVSVPDWVLGLGLASAMHFDLLISEVSLTERGEVDLLRTLSALYGSKGILLTTCPPKRLGDWRQAGFSRCLSKPITFHELLATVGEVADEYRGHQLGGQAYAGETSDESRRSA